MYAYALTARTSALIRSVDSRASSRGLVVDDDNRGMPALRLAHRLA
jgi:hypothetical protein